LAASTRRGNGEIHWVAADLGTDEGLEEVTRAVSSERVAAVVCAAGVESVTALAATSRPEVDRVVGLNLVAPILLTRQLLRFLVDGASVTFIGSIAAVRGRDRHAVYGAAKAGLIGLTRNLAVELAPGVRVNSVVPGATNTGMLAQYLDDYLAEDTDGRALKNIEMDAARVLLGHVAESAEVARTIVHVAVDATAMTGAVIPVDLGFTAR
jgi:NAD(P)-dependent dehydrogenase (short-subunit alcohol dehydrogenase family)